VATRSFLKTFKTLGRQKTCIYACFTFDSLSFGMREVEGYLSSKSIEFKRVVDPVPEFITPDVRGLYRATGFITILEVRGELGRAFYFFSTQLPLDLEDFMKPEFLLAFSLKSEESFEALLKVIFAKKISGARYKHRSFLNFFLSVGASVLLSSLMEVDNILLQAIFVGVLAFVLFMVVDYPFSVLYFRGVSLVPVPRVGEKVFLVRIRRPDKEGV